MKIYRISENKKTVHEFIPVNNVVQQENYTCGSSCFKSIAEMYGISLTHKQSEELCNATKGKGAKPEDIVEAAKTIGLDAVILQKVSIDILISEINKSNPVICDIQAWGDKDEYDDKCSRKDGHYVIATGYGDGLILFEDPSVKSGRAVLTVKDFITRWYDEEWGGKKVERLIIVFTSILPKKPRQNIPKKLVPME